MTSISQYIERRPSDCQLHPLGKPEPDVGMPHRPVHRSMQDMTHGLPSQAPPPPAHAKTQHSAAAVSTTVSVGGMPRKSALKNSNSKLDSNPPANSTTFRTHLPPPEFADQSPTSSTKNNISSIGNPGGTNRRGSFTLTESKSNVSLGPPHSSFRTLPRGQPHMQMSINPNSLTKLLITDPTIRKPLIRKSLDFVK